VHLHRHALGPPVPELRDGEARVHEDGAAGAGPGLRELLRRHDPEREAGVHCFWAELLGGRDAARREILESLRAGEGHSLLDRGKRAAVEQVGCVHGVAGTAQLVGKRLHAVGQSLNVVVKHYFGHPVSFDP
jgi:hypothetical protein